MVEPMKQSMEQWTEMATTWNKLWLDGMRNATEQWLALSGEWSALAQEMSGRSNQMLTREQKLAAERMQALQAQVEDGIGESTKAMQSMNDAGQRWAREAGKSFQAQSDAVQTQVGEWMATTTETVRAGGTKANGMKHDKVVN